MNNKPIISYSFSITPQEYTVETYLLEALYDTIEEIAENDGWDNFADARALIATIKSSL
jgi:hypothetical protein